MTYQEYLNGFRNTPAGMVRGAQPMPEAQWSAQQNPQQMNPFAPSGVNTPNLGSGDLQTEANKALLAGAVKAQSGGNTDQVQASNQAGTFNTAGQQQQTEAGTQTQQVQQTGNTSTSGSNTGTTQAIDSLGFGKLLQDAAGTATGADAARTGFLSGVLQKGDPALQEQTKIAVGNALSGPGMQGVGDSARARAASYAGQQVANNSLNGQLTAASQLAGPTATTTLASAGTPYVGQQTTGVQNQNQATTQNSNTLGTSLNALVNKESQVGTSNANSTQVAAGTTPQQQSSSGGSIICTVLVDQGLLAREVVEREVRFISLHWNKFRRAAVGYYFFCTPIARLALRLRGFSWCLLPLAWACSYEANRRGYKNRRFNLLAFLGYHSLFFTCDKLGWLVSLLAPQKALDKVTDHELVALLRKHKLEL